MTDTAHALLPPSGAHVWSICTANPTLVRRVPPLPQDDSASREGTAAHWVLARAAAGHAIGAGEITDEGHVTTDEMVLGAEMAVRHMQEVGARATTHPKWVVEQTVRNSAIHPECWGTPDAWFWDANARHLHVSDYKFGFGYVEVFRNPQLATYAALILHGLGDLALRDDTRVSLTVVQPRSFHKDGPIRHWHTTVGELRAIWHQLEMAAEEATSATPTARPGAHCDFCPARAECVANQAGSYRAADLARAPDLVTLPPQALGRELAVLEEAHALLESRVSGLRARAEAALDAGTPVPGWGFERSAGREQWADPQQAILTARTLGLDIAKPGAALTPRQAREKGMPAPLVDSMSARGAGTRKLVRVDSDKVALVFGTGVIDK